MEETVPVASAQVVRHDVRVSWDPLRYESDPVSGQHHVDGAYQPHVLRVLRAHAAQVLVQCVAVCPGRDSRVCQLLAQRTNPNSMAKDS